MTTNLDNLVAEYLDLVDRIDTLTAQLDHIKRLMRELGAGRHRTDQGNTITVTPTSRFNPGKFTQIITDPTIREACTEPTISAKKAKEVLAPALYDLCCSTAGVPRVSVKVPNHD